MTAVSTGACLERLVDDIADAGEHDTVTVGEIFEAVGSRSFGGLLLVPSLMTTSPLSGIPGVPSLSGVLIMLICVQYVMGRERIWLPNFILVRRLRRNRLQAAIRKVRPVMRGIDRVIYPRFGILINRWTFGVIAILCAALAATMPPLEILPFTSTATAFIIALFATAVLARDGLLAAFAFAGTVGLITAFALFVVPQMAALLGG